MREGRHGILERNSIEYKKDWWQPQLTSKCVWESHKIFKNENKDYKIFTEQKMNFCEDRSFWILSLDIKDKLRISKDRNENYIYECDETRMDCKLCK